MSDFDLNRFRKEFLQSDGWMVSDCYKTYDDKFIRKDAQDAYEGAKWGFKAGAASRQVEIDELQKEVNKEREQATEYFTDLEFANAKCRELQKRIDETVKICDNLRTDLIRENHVEYDKGWKDCATSIYHQLKKGENND